MIQPIPALTGGKPKLVNSFKCWTFIVIQVVGGATLYIAESDNALCTTTDNGIINALQINQASGIVPLWWIGDLWVAGSIAFNAIIGIPGVNTGSGLQGSPSSPDNILQLRSQGTL
jgi:hypothetical protein